MNNRFLKIFIFFVPLYFIILNNNVKADTYFYSGYVNQGIVNYTLTFSVDNLSPKPGSLIIPSFKGYGTYLGNCSDINNSACFSFVDRPINFTPKNIDLVNSSGTIVSNFLYGNITLPNLKNGNYKLVLDVGESVSSFFYQSSVSVSNASGFNSDNMSYTCAIDYETNTCTDGMFSGPILMDNEGNYSWNYSKIIDSINLQDLSLVLPVTIFSKNTSPEIFVR